MTPDKVEAMVSWAIRIARILADWKPNADGEAVADAIIIGLLRYSIATESEHEIELARRPCASLKTYKRNGSAIPGGLLTNLVLLTKAKGNIPPCTVDVVTNRYAER